MFSLLKRQSVAADLTSSILFSDSNFYPAFQKDLQKCQRELIIESPFITQRRLATLSPTLQKLKSKGVKVVVNTREVCGGLINH